MPSPLRNPKTLADWFELDSFRRSRGPRRYMGLAALAAMAVGAATLFASWFVAPGAALFQAAPVTSVHAPFNDRCEACHQGTFQTARRLWPGEAKARSTSNEACSHCHEVGPHQPGALDRAAEPDCAGCHREHRGGSLVRVADGHCTACHADLPGSKRVSSFADHPDFAPLAVSDPGTVRFNHAAHLNLPTKSLPALAEHPSHGRGRLDCQDCHQPDADRRYFRPVRYEDHCRSCHPLLGGLTGRWENVVLQEEADHSRQEPVPHGLQPPEVDGVLRERLLRFARDHAAALDPAQAAGPERPFPGRRLDAPPASPDEWVEAQLQPQRASLLSGRGGCPLCHAMEGADGPPALARVTPGRIPQRWLSHGRFDHGRHRTVACAECHAVEPSAATADVLLPHVAACQQCHNPKVGVRSDCVACHDYHDHGHDGPAGGGKIAEFLQTLQGRGR